VFERPDSGERAILVHFDFHQETNREDLNEFKELARSAGVEVVAVVCGTRQLPDRKFFCGSGKVEEISEVILASEADVVLFNHSLSPSQQRNLEAVFKVRVIDRTGVILDIFAQRARTHEGKLQVELAQLEYMSTRLIRGWTHLERQKGGIGLRGPGETQLETDRRLLRGLIKYLLQRLEKVRRQRDQGRRARQRAELPTISLVGYTNAGKSTLFNRLTHADVFAADQLFATLDPTLRRVELPDVGKVILADTVGFIRHLPHKLVEAFRATLEETVNATLLLHVVDAADPRRDENMSQVDGVLQEIGAQEIPMLMVYNKIDLLALSADAPGAVPTPFAPRLDRDELGVPERVWVSAQTGAGMELLLDAITERLGLDVVHEHLCLGPQLGKLRAALFEAGSVLNERYDIEGMQWLEIRMPRSDFNRLLSHAGVTIDELVQSPNH
jgi:GTP-binding protein HflX